MHKIEKLTATKSTHEAQTSLIVQVKLDSGLTVQSSLPIYGNNIERDSEKAVEQVNDIIAPILEGLSPLRQKEVDKMVSELSIVHKLENVNTSLAISLALLKSAASLQNETLVEYIERVYSFNKTKSPHTSVVYTICKNIGQPGAFKEITLIPSRSKKLSDSFNILRDVTDELYNKAIPSNSINSLMNTVQLETISNAINQRKISLHNDLYLGIKPHLKLTEDHQFICNDILQNAPVDQIIEYFKEIHALYSPLIVESAFSINDVGIYELLHKEIGDETIITIGSDIINAPHQLKKYAESVPASMISLQHQNITSVSHYIELIKIAHDSDWKTMIDTTGLTDKSTLQSLSFAANADFIKIDSCSPETEKELHYVGQAS